MLDDRLAIVGTAGSGKTFAAKGMTERLIDASARLCIVDPLGVWFGLRSGADGDAGGGLPVTIFGGQHADVPITEHDGAALGRIIASADIRCIVDVSELGSGAARRRFMSAFAETLYDVNRDSLHLVLDEADLLCPQRPLPDQTTLQGKIGEIVRRGRVRGFIPWLITQRPAVLDKDVLSQADTLIAMKLTSSQDRAAIGAWIEGQADRDAGRQILADLPRLRQGTGYVWAPGHGMLERVAFPAIRTFDSSKTPKRGERLIAGKLAAVDVSAIGSMLAQQREKQPEGKRPTADALEAAERRGYERGLAEGRSETVELRDTIRSMQGAIDGALGFLVVHVKREDGVGIIDVQRPRPPVTIEARPARPPPRQAQPSRPRADDGLHSAARALLTVLASRAPARLTWNQAATLAGLKARGGHFNAGRQQLRTEALIGEDGSLIWATRTGIARAGDVPDAPSTPAEVRAMWCAKLPSPAPEMIAALNDGPRTVAALAAALGKQPRGGHWNGGMAVLRNNGLITIASGVITLSEEMRDA